MSNYGFAMATVLALPLAAGMGQAESEPRVASSDGPSKPPSTQTKPQWAPPNGSRPSAGAVRQARMDTRMNRYKLAKATALAVALAAGTRRRDLSL